MITIDIKALKAGVYEYEWTPDAEELELDKEVFRDLEVEARLDFHAGRAFVMLTTQATASLICDRTLEPFEQDVEGNFEILFASPEMLDAMEDAGDDIHELAADAEEIDITEMVRDTFILSIPLRKISPGAEQEELPLEFGRPEGKAGTDPRWEALRKLSSEGDSEAGEA